MEVKSIPVFFQFLYNKTKILVNVIFLFWTMWRFIKNRFKEIFQL